LPKIWGGVSPFEDFKQKKKKKTEMGTVFSSAPLPPQTARSLVGGRSGT